MKHSALMASAAVAVLLAAAPAFAADADLAAIRREIGAMRHDYETKIRGLEVRLAKAEADARAAKASAAHANARASTRTRVVAAPPPQSQPQSQSAQTPVVAAVDTMAPVPTEVPLPQSGPVTPPTSAGAFNPGIAAVLNGFYAESSRDPVSQHILGFALGDETGLVPRGFSLGESEISLAANIDPYFKGFMDLSFGNDGSASVEEAYIQTLALGGGFSVKAGRFFSGIAYLNERHAHDWSFSDASLPYRAFLGNQYGDDGVQVRWLAPTDIFLEFGAEWFRGDSFPAGGATNDGKGTVTAFVHAGDDINDSSSWLAGLSYLHSRAQDRGTGGDLFSGYDDVGIASLVYKWAPGGNPVQENLVLSGEYFHGREKGTINGVPIALDRDGWYAQGVYQFMPRWSVGLRYAQLAPDSIPGSLSGSVLDDLGRTPRAETALLEFDTSEFGRLRLQYTHDQSDLKPNDEIVFQYTVIYGPHGAHRY